MTSPSAAGTARATRPPLPAPGRGANKPTFYVLCYCSFVFFSSFEEKRLGALGQAWVVREGGSIEKKVVIVLRTS
jgi:hypothetical protein